MTPFCIHCERFMVPRPHNHRVVTTSGPIWRGQYYTCPACNTSVISDWKMNAEPERIKTHPDELRLRRTFYPYFYKERNR